MKTRYLPGFLLIATIGCGAPGGAGATAEAEEQPAAQGLHREDGGTSCQRWYVVTKDKRVAQVPKDDVELIDTLVPHHEAAVEMARMELDRGEDAEVKAMAEEMKATQSREIEALRAIRERLTGCSDVTPLQDRHMQKDMEAMMDMGGAALDRMFLEEMIPHHASALSFVHNALPNLSEPDLEEMAHQIIDAQSMEIGHMHMKLTGMAHH